MARCHLALVFGLLCAAPAFGQPPETLPKDLPTAPAATTAAPPSTADAVIEAPIIAVPSCFPGCFDWSKSHYRYPKIFWPVGFPAILPTGPGYYSAWDWLKGDCRDAAPKNGYPRFFAIPQPLYDADFSYVDKPGYDATVLEKMHRIHLGDDWLFGTGGEFRWRYTNERNARLTGLVNEYDLTRLRIFGDLWYQDKFRVYAEFINANSFNHDLAPIGPDRNWGDLLNAFVEFKTLTVGEENVYTRIGRQQMLLGSQRIISPLDWTNNMRTFEGVRAFRRSEKFDVDLFWMQPVIPNAREFDTVDHRQNFAGIYTTQRPAKDQILDLYYLYLGNNDPPGTGAATGVGALQRTPYDYHTLGFRYAGKSNQILSRCEKNEFLWDFENMYQMGSRGSGDIAAANFSNGVGYHFGDAMWNPTFWMYFDYATGSNSVQGTNTYNQMYPLGHYYFGWLDYVGRANIQDLNFHAYLYPTKWITLNAQYHIFELANARDALYNANAAVIRSDPTGRAGRNVGSELDFIVNWHVSRNTDIVTAYSHMFAGDFLDATGPSNNLNTFWFIYNVRW